jgi:predicted RND superfamily exporter protein
MNKNINTVKTDGAPGGSSRLYRLFDLIGRRIGLVTLALVIAVIGLGVVGPMVANTDEPNFDPSGEVFDTLYESQDTLQSTSSIATASFLVEAIDGGNVLTPAALREWRAASERVASNERNARFLNNRFDTEAHASVPAVFSIADAVDAALDGGIARASDEEIVAAVTAVLDQSAPTAFLRFTLSEAAEFVNSGGDSAWVSPAFMTQVTYDADAVGSSMEVETWLREVQAEFRVDAVHTDSIGIAIDIDTTFEEATTQSSPFIFLAVGLIVLLVALVHRSFWSAAIVGAGLSGTALAYYGTSALLGLQMGSLLLSFIVPIAMISFGVDFYIHGVGRVREMQVEHGDGIKRAYPMGMTAVFTAMLLAVSSSIAAFLSNAASGTEAIIEFGIGAAIALGWAYLILGLIAPRITIGLEDFTGPNPVKRFSKVPYAFGTLLTAVFGGLAVTLSAVMPAAGAAMFVVFIVGFIGVPSMITRRRNRRALTAGRSMQRIDAGSAHGLEPVGRGVAFLARWKVVTIPMVILVAVLGFIQATNVESGFDIKDFISSDTSFAQSIDRVSDHFPTSGEGSSFVYVDGDLTDPATLAAMDEIVTDLNGSAAGFGRTTDGELIVGLTAADLVRMTMATDVAGDLGLVDTDGDGFPDSAAGVSAVYDYIWANGVPSPDGAVAVPADEVRGIVAPTDGGQASAVVINVTSFSDGAIIIPVQDALEDAAATFNVATTGADARVSGEVIAQYTSMESFTRSMIVSLPLAAVLTFLIASIMLRSVRYALVSVVPIGLVVVGVYAFMSVSGYTVNVVTATIAAIAVGVGIDFSTHFTARYREELAVVGSRLDAVRRAGAGTGGALVLSALTSILGFTVMAFAPMPIFATFGLLTAVMIALSLGVALLVLPSFLVLVSKDRIVDELDEPAREAVLVG